MLFKDLKQIPMIAIYLILGIFFVTLGAFLVFPILALFMRESLGITAAQIGVLMTIKLWGQWGGALVGGKLGDSIGLKTTMILGLILRIVAFLTIVSAHSFTGALAGMIFLGLSAALFNPASKAALILVSNPATRVTLLSLRETAVNLGAALGPLIGFLAGVVKPDYLFFSGAALYALLAIATAFILPSISAAKNEKAVVGTTFRWSNFLRTDLLI